MGNESNPFAALLERFAQGDEQAARALFDQYHKALLVFIRHRLNRSPQLRSVFDSTDFLQELWHDIVAQPDKLREFATFEALLNYLAGFARHKIETAQRKYLTAEKRDLRRQHHLSDQTVAAAASAIVDPRPNPAQESASHDAWIRWLLTLSARQRYLVLMLRAGFTYQEIAEKFGCSERSISRLAVEIRVTPSPDI